MKEYVMNILMHEDSRLHFSYQDNVEFLKTFEIKKMTFTLDDLSLFSTKGKPLSVQSWRRIQEIIKQIF